MTCTEDWFPTLRGLAGLPALGGKPGVDLTTRPARGLPPPCKLRFDRLSHGGNVAARRGQHFDARFTAAYRSNGGKEEGHEDRAPRASRHALALLVADDHDHVPHLLERALGAVGYRVLTAADGEEALRLAREQRPDLVLLDVAMPKVSGIEVCRRMKGDPALRHIPIMLVTASAQEADRRAMACGADGYVTKPFGVRSLVREVRRLTAHSVPT